MKSCLIVSLLATTACWAQMSWPENEITVRAQVGAEIVPVNFRFTNISSEAVEITGSR